VTRLSARHRGWVRPLLSVAVAAAAFAFVAHVVPFRDRCATPDAPAVMLPVVRTADGCTLLAPTGPRPLEPPACAALTCEPGLFSAFGRVRPARYLALFALYLAGNFAWAARWFLLVRLGGLRLRLLQVWRVTLEAQAGGIMLPGGVGGDALRIAAAVGHGAPPSVVIASVLLDRVIGLVTLAGTAAAVSVSMTGLAPTTRATTLALAAFPVAFGVALALRPVAARLVRSAPRRLRRLFAVVEPAIDYALSPGALSAIARAVVVSGAVSLVQLLVIRGIIAALGVTPVTESWVFVGSAIAFMVAAVPVLPGGWGTADAAFVFFLARAGIGPETGLAASLLYRSLWYLSGIVGGCLQLARATRNRPSVAAPP